MPKSKEFIEDSDSDEPKKGGKGESLSDEESPKATVKKAKAKSSTSQVNSLFFLIFLIDLGFV